MLVDLSWHDFELLDRTPVLDDAGEQTKDETGQPAFNEEPTGVKMQVKPMDFQTFQRMMSLFKDFKPDQDMQQQAIQNNPIANPEIVVILKDTLPTHVRNFTGLQVKDEDGSVRDGKVDDLLAHGSMLLYAVNILLKIFAISNISGKERDEIKKHLGG